ncbi:nuclear transport factor 2 family protein [Teredinibacter sp. KSP-S5-2]|uniref:nuclear transport factor 2 family protein n=1 Tax=Teredinibacter sp. KSP-S5-2 TaxID=3034506 RepID=UPI002934C303|nr:nuclear transport factor 2 family protein [Teredinibacter sp. KSP-S5-2]WNO08460.1 nuclear transport factor 2 family protein [Teredinibacter sp. KSP-S5-2]
MHSPLVEQFKAYFQDLRKSDLSQLEDLYERHIIFKDPIHKIEGLVPLQDYMHNLCTNLTECRFEYLDILEGQDCAYIKWIMHFRHPKLGNRLISLRGMSHIQFQEKIVFHEDVYDMGAMIYEQLPLLGRIIRWLRQRLAN